MEMSEKGILLHVGLTKTGTKTIQKSLFSCHSQIYYLGKIEQNQMPRGCLSALVYDILETALWKRGQPLALGRIKELYQNKLLPEVPQGKLFVGSWESFGNSKTHIYLERLRRIKAIFNKCRVMINLRNHLFQIPSQYLQNLHGHFVKQNRPWMGTAPVVKIEEWFEKWAKHRQGIHNLFCYSQNIQASINLLGRENVGVFLFEELVENPEQYYRNVCGFMGIDPEEGVKLSGRQHLNKRISQNQIDFLKTLNASWWRRMMVKRKPLKVRKQMMEQITDRHIGTLTPARVFLTSELTQEIAAASQIGHQWLVENLDLPLEKYGYPL